MAPFFAGHALTPTNKSKSKTFDLDFYIRANHYASSIRQHTTPSPSIEDRAVFTAEATAWLEVWKLVDLLYDPRGENVLLRNVLWARARGLQKVVVVDDAQVKGTKDVLIL